MSIRTRTLFGHGFSAVFLLFLALVFSFAGRFCWASGNGWGTLGWGIAAAWMAFSCGVSICAFKKVQDLPEHIWYLQSIKEMVGTCLPPIIYLFLRPDGSVELGSIQTEEGEEFRLAAPPEHTFFRANGHTYACLQVDSERGICVAREV